MPFRPCGPRTRCARLARFFRVSEQRSVDFDPFPTDQNTVKRDAFAPDPELEIIRELEIIKYVI